MEVKDGISAYAAAHPEGKVEASHISRALRLARICTMKQLREWYQLRPEELLNIRGIGSIRLDRIGEILQFYEAMAPTEKEQTETHQNFAQGAFCLSSIAAEIKPSVTQNMKEV